MKSLISHGRLAAHRGAALSAVALATLLGGCASSSGVTPPQAQLRELTLAQASRAELAAPEWWKSMGDAQLDRLMQQVLNGQPSLGLARARVARAQAAVGLADTASQPVVNGSLEVTRQRFTQNGMIPPPLAGTIRESGTLQLSGGWELDFFGRYRSALDAAVGQWRAAQAEHDAARVMLSANLARAYVQWARLNDQMAVAERVLAQREAQLALVQQRVEAGLDNRIDLRVAQGAVPEARQQLEAVREQRALAANAVAALVGQPELPLQPASLAALTVPPAPQHLPADLLGRRADVVAARWRVEAAVGDAAQARAQFYPNVNLIAFAGASSIGLGRLLDAGSTQWGITPAVRLPIFDAGRLRAQLAGKHADLDAAVESYNAQVLDALRDTADQLASADSLARQRAEQRHAQAAAESAHALARERQQAGVANGLQVLAAESGVLQQRRIAIDLTARALDAQIGLIRATGGGYVPDTATRTLAAHKTNTSPQP